jgi:hypothetical protein
MRLQGIECTPEEAGFIALPKGAPIQDRQEERMRDHIQKLDPEALYPDLDTGGHSELGRACRLASLPGHMELEFYFRLAVPDFLAPSTWRPHCPADNVAR